MADNYLDPKYKSTFLGLLQPIIRPGIDVLIGYLESSDFFTAPASTRFHSNVEGGLVFHKLQVYRVLKAKIESNPKVFPNTSADTIAVTALLHDLCKINTYRRSMRNKKNDNGQWISVPFWEFVDESPYTHGESSVQRIEACMSITEEERLAIRWHMGFTEPSETRQQFSRAVEKYPLVLALHTADAEAAAFYEKVSPVW